MRGFAFAVIFIMLLSYTSLAQQASCDYKVEIVVDGKEFEKEDFKWRMKATKIEGKSTNITGTAEIQSNGKTIKRYKPWTSSPISKQKTSSEYSPNLKPGDYEITAEINVECDDINKDNNVDVKEIKIKGEVEETKTKKTSSQETKTANQVEEEKIETETIKKSPQPKQTVEEETSNIIQLTKTNNKKTEQSPLTTYTTQKPETVYVSSNEKAKGLIMIFLLTLSVLLNIILIWKR